MNGAFSARERVKGRCPQPRWDGSPLEGRTILLRCEQGLGDSLQFIRYAELVRQRGGKVAVRCQPQLARLLTSCPGLDIVDVEGEPGSAFDCHVPLLSLPGIFGTSLDNIPNHVPYLSADSALVDHWRRELEAGGQRLEAGGQRRVPNLLSSGLQPPASSLFKIGIAWQGRTTQISDRVRSIPLAKFAPLAGVRGVRLYSLQMGQGREQLAELDGQFSVTDLGDQLGDFCNTAAIMCNLDLVITCDSAGPPGRIAGPESVGGPALRA